MYVDGLNQSYYKLALHLHTTLSDGKNTTEQVALEYKEKGYDAIAFTDHWYYGEEQVLHGLTVISGAEYNVGAGCGILGEMHILGIGMKSDPMLEKTATRAEIVKAIIAAGGVPVLAHPAWSMNTPEDAEQLPEIAITEIYNAVSEAHESNRAYSDFFVDISANKGRYYQLFATDDAHYYDGSDQCRGFVMVKAEDASPASLMAAIKRGDFYASQGPHLSVERVGDALLITTSPCSMIATLSNATYLPGRVVRGEGISRFEYKIREKERWIRVEAVDAEGKRAYSNVIKL